MILESFTVLVSQVYWLVVVNHLVIYKIIRKGVDAWWWTVNALLQRINDWTQQISLISFKGSIILYWRVVVSSVNPIGFPITRTRLVVNHLVIYKVWRNGEKDHNQEEERVLRNWTVLFSYGCDYWLLLRWFLLEWLHWNRKETTGDSTR